MTSAQIALVQNSWKQVLPIAEDAAAIFYAKLFELDPALKPMFRGDMKEQGKKLMQMITVAVKSLGSLEDILPAVQALGRRHVGYGVEDRHYDTVGTALLATLEAGLGKAFTPEMRDAWAQTYGTLAGVMKDAAAKGPIQDRQFAAD